MSILKMYTDGACSGNQNQENTGGWGAILEFGENQRELFGGEENTTNNRMELTAVIEAFKALKRDGLKIQVFTDSSYVANCFREKWYETWRANGWKNAKKEPVENRDLWEQLLPLVEKNQVLFYRVKGHVNLDSPNTNIDSHYEKFKEMNGKIFTRDDFLYITRMNNRADALANQGIDQVRD
ncbi:MAG: ribonuclease HI [Firmicutes bacterium]|nr:ribonuclease HI [Bacillota bacterium]